MSICEICPFRPVPLPLPHRFASLTASGMVYPEGFARRVATKGFARRVATKSVRDVPPRQAPPNFVGRASPLWGGRFPPTRARFATGDAKGDRVRRVACFLANLPIF
ncbi:MAG: hypothetical protein QME51_03240 [Planctomycetota bacterium]|nr:hypothetical protein [Planctomycetota bacterium]